MNIQTVFQLNVWSKGISSWRCQIKGVGCFDCRKWTSISVFSLSVCNPRGQWGQMSRAPSLVVAPWLAHPFPQIFFSAIVWKRANSGHAPQICLNASRHWGTVETSLHPSFFPENTTPNFRLNFKPPFSMGQIRSALRSLLSNILSLCSKTPSPSELPAPPGACSK